MTDCERTRELLWPLDRPRKVDPGVEEARAHLEECVDCRAFFERDAALGRRLRGTRLGTDAPAGLRARAIAAIEAEPAFAARSALVRRAARWTVAAAALLVAAVGLSRLGLGVASAEASYIADYQSHMDEIVPDGGPDLAQTYEFFMSEFGVPVTPVTFDAGTANRAMICLIDGRRVATVEYELDGHKIAHYRVPVSESALGLGELRSATKDDLCIIRWADGEFEHALVSDMEEVRLRQVAVERFSAKN